MHAAAGALHTMRDSRLLALAVDPGNVPPRLFAPPGPPPPPAATLEADSLRGSSAAASSRPKAPAALSASCITACCSSFKLKSTCVSLMGGEAGGVNDRGKGGRGRGDGADCSCMRR